MKAVEQCSCSASFELEHDDADIVLAEIKLWREKHKCNGPAPWEKSVRSTTDAQIQFRFGIQEWGVVV